MKQIINKKYFLGLFLLSLFLTVGIVSVTNGQTININPGQFEHIIRLHSLFLWHNSVDNTVSMKVNTGEDFLTIQGGLAIGSNHNVADSAAFSAIGGGKSNTISGLGNGIVGGEGNSLSGKYSLIGGGKFNTIDDAENSVIGGGSGNAIYSQANNSVIAGGEDNVIGEGAHNSVILGGQNNQAEGKNALVMGQNAKGSTGSFAWNATANENSARIDAKSGVLIGTYTPITGVKLVINGAVSLTGTFDINGGTGGEIRVVNGCIYAFDGKNWQVMGKSSRTRCGGEIKACQFGETLLYQGDTVDAYKKFWSSNCNNEKVSVTCSGGDLVRSGVTGTYYPYCYVIGGSNGGNGGGSNGGNGGGSNGGNEKSCDFNGDGRVNNNDSVYLSNLILEAKTDVNTQDMNGDGIVDVTDVMFCANGGNEKSCDFNGDGRVNNNDSVYLSNLILEAKTDVNTQDMNGDGIVDVTDVMLCANG